MSAAMLFQKTKLVVKGLLIIGAILLAGRCFWAWQTVTRIAATVQRREEMGFGPLGEADRLGAAVDAKIQIERWFPRGIIDVAFRPVREFEVYYFQHLRGDLGRELQRFPHLKKVTVYENIDGEPSEADWLRLVGWIRQMPELEELDIGGEQLTDAALTALAGHPRLRVLTVQYSRLTKKSLVTFQSLPRLATLEIYEVFSANGEPVPTTDELATGLPGVKIHYDAQ